MRTEGEQMTNRKKALSEGVKIGYSERERLLFKAIARKRVTTIDLVELSNSFHARQSIVAGLKGLAKKMEVNGEAYRLCRTERQGPHPTEWWLEAR
jgi:hypothetical protein